MSKCVVIISNQSFEKATCILELCNVDFDLYGARSMWNIYVDVANDCWLLASPEECGTSWLPVGQTKVTTWWCLFYRFSWQIIDGNLLVIGCVFVDAMLNIKLSSYWRCMTHIVPWLLVSLPWLLLSRPYSLASGVYSLDSVPLVCIIGRREPLRGASNVKSSATLSQIINNSWRRKRYALYS